MKTLTARDPQSILEAIEILRRGGVVVYPTETAYGLGGDWTKPSVHRRIRLIKGRERGKPLSVIVPSREAAKKYVNFSPHALPLAKKYWPGPLSLVLPLKRGIKSLSVRISSYPIATKLVRGLGRPLIATSANVSGKGTLYDAQEIVRVFAKRKHKPDAVIDAGRLKRVKPSTIVAVKGDEVEVLREGPIKVNSKFKS